MRSKGDFIDLVLMIHPRELDKAQMRSLLADAVASPEKGNAAANDGSAPAGGASGIEQLATVIASVRTAHPRDLSVAIADALFSLASGDARRIEPALQRLLGLIEESPLEPLPAGAGQRPAAGRGRTIGSSVAGGPSLLEAESRRQAGRLRRQAGCPGHGGRAPSDRPVNASGHVPRGR